jgi:Flp pilus assembly protein TadB
MVGPAGDIHHTGSRKYVMILTVRCERIPDLCSNNRKNMKQNMGGMDRTVRIIVALLIGVLAYTGVINGTLAIILLVLAAVFVLTSFVSFCPLYLPFGISTCKKQ